MTAHSAGWTTSTRFSSSASSRASVNDQSANSASASAHSAIRAANTGDWVSNSRAIPAH